MNNSLVSNSIQTAANTVYRVYRKGTLIAVGTPDDLQLLFNERARSLKFKLKDWASQPDDIQHKWRYQIEFDAEYQAEIQNCLEYIKFLAADCKEPFQWPEDLDEHELLFNPGSAPLQEKIKRKRSRHYRYYRKHLVETWKDAQKEIAAAASPEIDKLLKQLPSLEREAERAAREFHRVAPVADKWTQKLTEVERNHLEKKKADRLKRLAAMQSKFYK